METTSIYLAERGEEIRQARSKPILQLLILVLLTLIAPQLVLAANYPLELVMPRAAGTSPTAGFNTISAGHRIYKAYPGLPYNIRAVAFGGAYPYAFAISNAPAGMTINGRSGEINWPNPSGSSATPTITVTDAEGARQSSAWTIAVTTSGFKFVDRVRGTPNGNGTIASPWQDLLQIYNAGAPGEFVYFRSGTYTNAGIPRDGGDVWRRIVFNGTSQPMVWLAYPGEVPRFDGGHTSSDIGALIRFQPVDSTPVYMDGLEIFNFLNIGMQVVSGTSDYNVFRRLKIHGMVAGIEEGNPAGIMFTDNYTDPTQYAVIQDSEFYDLNNGGGLKFYSHEKVLVEDNVFRDSTDGFDLKTHVPRFEVRGNTFRNIQHRALYGNLHFLGARASGEWRYNNINTPAATVAVDVNQDGEAGVVHIYRNTINGPTRVREVSADDGPFHFFNNVIVNNNPGSSGSHIEFVSVAAPARVVVRDNLVGGPGDGIIDSNGLLSGDFERYLGTMGHMVGGSSTRPMPPEDVTAE